MANGRKTGGRQAGVPNKASLMGREYALRWGPDAIQQLAALGGLVKGPDGQPIGMAENESVRKDACKDIADRAFGKPTQPIAGDDEFDPIRTVMRVEFVNPPRLGSDLDRSTATTVEFTDGADDA